MANDKYFILAQFLNSKKKPLFSLFLPLCLNGGSFREKKLKIVKLRECVCVCLTTKLNCLKAFR